MANLNIGQAAALSPVTNFNLTDSLMKGAQFGMQQQAAEARALAARMKKNKILSLDMSNIHPTLRKEAEDAAYQTTAAMKISADSGEDPMAVKNIGQFKLNQLQSESKRRFDLEKSNPNDYVMDQEAMTLFSQGKNKEAKSLLESKGYDPQLISAINPEEALFLPKKVKIQEALDKNYGYKNNPGLYEAAEKQKILGFGKERQIFRMNEQAANAAALEMAGNTDVQATVLKDYSTQFKTTLSKVITDNPGIDQNVARGKAFVDVIKDPKNNLLPTGFEDDKPTKGATFNINTGNNINPKEPAGFLVPRTLILKQTKGIGTYKKQEDIKVQGPAFTIHPQNVSLPNANIISTDGKEKRNKAGAGEYSSGYITSLPINDSGVDISLYRKGKVFYTIKAGQVVDPKYIKDGSLKGHLDKISYKPVALLTEEKEDASGTKVTKSYYTEVSEGDNNWFEDSEDKSGRQSLIITALQRHSIEENKKYGLGEYPKVASQTQAPVKKPGKVIGVNTIKGLVGKKGYEGYTEKELIDYYKGQRYEIK